MSSNAFTGEGGWMLVSGITLVVVMVIILAVNQLLGSNKNSKPRQWAGLNTANGPPARGVMDWKAYQSGLLPTETPFGFGERGAAAFAEGSQVAVTSAYAGEGVPTIGLGTYKNFPEIDPSSKIFCVDEPSEREFVG